MSVDDPSARSAVARRLGDLYTRWAHEQAIQFAQGDGREWWSWGDLGDVHATLARETAGRILADHTAIAIVVRQRPVMAAAELAALAMGRSALLITPLQSDRDLAAEIAALAPAVVVAHEADWERDGVVTAAQRAGVLGLQITDVGVVSVRVAADVLNSGPELDAAVTVLTSGTTGPAKRLPVAWETFIRLGGGPDGREPKPGRGAVILSVPLVTLGGLLSMARLVFGGRPMAMIERFEVHAWAALVKEHKPKVMGAPPPVVKMILDAGISADHFEGVTAYMTSSAPVAAETAAEFERRYGIPVLLGYGATEFLNSVTGWTTELWARFGATKLGSVGRAYPGVTLQVIDPGTGQQVGVGEEGVLEVDPPQRAGHLPDGWLRTSDRACIDEDDFLWILGRTDEVIIRGGFKIDLNQVEAALCEHPQVTAACAVGLPDARLGQVPGAVVTVAGDTAEGTDQAPTAGDLITWVRDRVPPYAVPTVVRVVEAIPTTSTLKTHRAEVQRLLDGS